MSDPTWKLPSAGKSLAWFLIILGGALVLIQCIHLIREKPEAQEEFSADTTTQER